MISLLALIAALQVPGMPGGWDMPSQARPALNTYIQCINDGVERHSRSDAPDLTVAGIRKLYAEVVTSCRAVREKQLSRAYRLTTDFELHSDRAAAEAAIRRAFEYQETLPALPSETLQQAAVLAYQNCLAPIVRANESAGKANYQPLEMVLESIKLKCSKERTAAGDALAATVATQNPELRQQPTAAEKEHLIHEATIRWASNVVARLAVEEK